MSGRGDNDLVSMGQMDQDEAGVLMSLDESRGQW